MRASTVFIGLGSNLEHPLNQLQRAIQAMTQLPHSQLQKVSPFYCTAPVGTIQQPNFINAVVQLTTTLSPFSLLLQLQQIERKQGRLRHQRWGPRTLDLDMLCYEQLVLDHPWLILPHPRLLQRLFVLRPFADIAPDWLLANGLTVAQSRSLI